MIAEKILIKYDTGIENQNNEQNKCLVDRKMKKFSYKQGIINNAQTKQAVYKIKIKIN